MQPGHCHSLAGEPHVVVDDQLRLAVEDVGQPDRARPRPPGCSRASRPSAADGAARRWRRAPASRPSPGHAARRVRARQVSASTTGAGRAPPGRWRRWSRHWSWPYRPARVGLIGRRRPGSPPLRPGGWPPAPARPPSRPHAAPPAPPSPAGAAPPGGPPRPPRRRTAGLVHRGRGEDRLDLVGVLQHPQRRRLACRGPRDRGRARSLAAISSRTPGRWRRHAQRGQHGRRLAHLVAQVALGLRQADVLGRGPGSATVRAVQRSSPLRDRRGDEPEARVGEQHALAVLIAARLNGPGPGEPARVAGSGQDEPPGPRGAARRSAASRNVTDPAGCRVRTARGSARCRRRPRRRRAPAPTARARRARRRGPRHRPARPRTTR